MDAVIIADADVESFSGTHGLKLTIGERVADIQTVINYVAHQGRLQPPIEGDDYASWASAPKLNGIYLQSFLSAHGFVVGRIDNFYTHHAAFTALMAQSPKAILISTTFITSTSAFVRLAADIRCHAPRTPIIASGPFILTSYCILGRSDAEEYRSQKIKEEYLFLEVDKEPSIDLYIVSARGEYLAKEVLQRLVVGSSLNGIANSAVLKNGHYHFFKSVDDRQMPVFPIKWQALEDQVFTSSVVPLQASSGCPYHCAFCNFVKNPASTQVKPLENLIEEMRAVRLRGARYVWFVDDNFRLGRSDLDAVCRRFIDADLGILWMTFIRAGTLADIDPALLRRAGCIEVQLGIESADPHVLSHMNKKASPELYANVLKNLLDAGINCSCYLIFGFPGETQTSADRTLTFMKSFDNVKTQGTIAWSIFPFIVAPLSPIYEPAMREKYRLEGYLRHWRHATMDAKQAMAHVRRAFLSVESSGAIYRSDNQALLAQLSVDQRHAFHRTRQRLAQKALQGVLAADEILAAFKPIFKDNANAAGKEDLPMQTPAHRMT